MSNSALLQRIRDPPQPPSPILGQNRPADVSPDPPSWQTLTFALVSPQRVQRSSCASCPSLKSPSVSARRRSNAPASTDSLDPLCAVALPGAVHLHDCPREPYIPIYLIVLGVFGLTLALLACLPCARQAKDEPPNPLSRLCTAWNSLTSFFLFCWFIAGEFLLFFLPPALR